MTEVSEHAAPRPESLRELPRPVELVATARMPSRFGAAFRIVGFRTLDGIELGAVIKGDIAGREGVPVRLHSACFTGDIMGSLRCDCRDQLESALSLIGRAERGAVLYLPQEGRGIGLVNKVRAYALQDTGLDTVEANHALGFEDDLRKYDVAAAMIHALGVRSICLLTNNPSKIIGVRGYGVRVVGVIPLRTPRNPHNSRYLDTKRDKSGHRL